MMAGSSPSCDWNRLLVDVCTQRDFLERGAILQVANLDTLIPSLRRLFEWADAAWTPIVSAVESHRPTEPVSGYHMHCVDGTPGQKKLAFTLLDPWILVETDNYLSLPPDLTQDYRQIIFRKRTRDVLSNPKADRFLTHLKADEFIVFGVGLERAVKSVALGLLSRHKSVTVVTDACGYWSAADAELAVRQLLAKHIRLTTVAEITTSRPQPKPGARVRGERHRLDHARSNGSRCSRSGAVRH